MKARKLLSVLLALAMAVTTMAVFAVSASAESIESSAKTVVNGKTYTVTLKEGWGFSDGEPADFKIVAKSAGKLVVSFVSYSERIYISALDKNGNSISSEKYEATTGTIKDGQGCVWNKAVEKCVGKATYSIKKGTTYIRFRKAYLSSGNGKLQVKFTFPSDDSSDGSSGVSITNFALTMKVGDTLQLDADLSAKTDDNVTWKSDKTSVAKVSATGKITAQAKGTATITASIGGSSMKIKVKVSG